MQMKFKDKKMLDQQMQAQRQMEMIEGLPDLSCAFCGGNTFVSKILNVKYVPKTHMMRVAPNGIEQSTLKHVRVVCYRCGATVEDTVNLMENPPEPPQETAEPLADQEPLPKTDPLPGVPVGDA